MIGNSVRVHGPTPAEHAASEDFIAMAAHELRGPITVVAAAVETLQQLLELEDDPQVRELLSMVVRNCRRMRQLASDVLSSVYIERGGLPLQLECVPLLPIIRWGVEAATVDPSLVTIDCEPATCATVDPQHAERVITNLVSNALNHGAPPIIVRAKRLTVQEETIVTVRDHGRGIPSDASDRLFERFSPLASHTPSSNGLGLSIARGLARSMGGELTYQPVDQGSLFVLTLPS